MLCSSAGAARNVSVAFLNPGSRADVFFGPMIQFMQAAAEDLGFDLEVYYGDRSHVLIDENVKKLFSQERKPDYVIGMNARGAGEDLLDRAEAAGVKTIIINQGFLEEARKQVGRPGEKYSMWLFDYLPDDTHAGYLLGKTLIENALANGLVDSKGMVHVIAVSGHEASTASVLREAGLKKAVEEIPQALLLQMVHANWKKDTARELTLRLLDRYPSTTVIWSASDAMGEGVSDALRKKGRRPGKDVLVGGIDWTVRAQEMVESGEFTVSVGGHFMDGARALVLLYDFIHGVDIPRSNQSHFSSLTAENIAQYRQLFEAHDWRKIDFMKFSKYTNTNLKEYDFSLEAVLRQVKGVR